MVKILAMADLQLGKGFSGVGLGANRFREQLFLTAEHIINEISSGFDIILILGDTFDRPDADWQLIERVAELLRHCDKPVHIIPGNHDYWHTGGVLWALDNELKDIDNIVIHSQQHPFRIESLDLTLYPGVLKQRMDLTDRTSWIPPREAKDGLRIGMFHESILPHGSFDPDVALNHDLDLALLGDWHGPSGDIEKSLIDQPERNLWYAGSPEAQNISQNWQGRVLSIDIDNGKIPIVSPIPVGKLKFTHIEFKFDEDMNEPLEILNESLGEISGDPELTFVRLNLSGEATLETLEKLNDSLDKFIENWPANIVKREQLRIILNSKNTDPIILQVEEELKNMNLDSATLARAMLLLRRYHRRLG